MTLDELLRMTEGRISPDDIFSLIAANIIPVDLHAAPLAEPRRVQLQAGPEVISKTTANLARNPHTPVFADLLCGSTVNWDGHLWNVVNLGETSVSLLSDDQRLSELPRWLIESLIGQNRIEVVTSKDSSKSAISERLSRARESDLCAANQRVRLISDYLVSGKLPCQAEATRRTFFRWLARYRAAEASSGAGYLGLLPESAHRGNCTPRLSEATRRLMEQFLDDDYETLKQKTRYASWAGLKLACENHAVVAPSYKTFCIAVKKRPALNQTLKRQGRRASYQLETFYWELDLKTPRHGDRPFEIVHIDHTELDVETVASTGQNLGRPWITIATDAFSRRTLAFYLTFDAPSYRSCMMTLRECVRRFSRLPQIFVIDGGREFESTYFETLLARYECMKKTRPPAKARFGSICERLFGVANTQFVHNLTGNTQITRNVRQVTKSVNPRSLAIWPLAELHQRLSQYLYEIRDTIAHPVLGESPRQAFEAGMTRCGQRLHRVVPYNQEFLMLTLPTTPKGTAKLMPGRGVKINHIYYWCEAFRNFAGECQAVPVRYDPFDVGIAYAFANKQWLRCHSEYYAVLKGRSQREVMLASSEMHQRRRNHSAASSVSAAAILGVVLGLTCLASADSKKPAAPPPKPAAPAAKPAGNPGGGATYRPNTGGSPANHPGPSGSSANRPGVSGPSANHPAGPSANHPAGPSGIRPSGLNEHGGMPPDHGPRPVAGRTMPAGVHEHVAPNGATVRMRPNGRPSDVHDPGRGMDVHHGLNGNRAISVERADHSRVFAERGRPGFVERPYPPPNPVCRRH